ncbi:MAG: TIGR00730 family Rossman fold protein [Deltaproteobacteria bacterium]|nr:TIGR00730 family Rossman fold protein [Deltaproteobacteria bacterium]
MRLCVFCGSSSGVRPIYTQAAKSLGALLASRGIPLVYGGGKVGLMGVLADAVLAAQGRVVGVIPRFLLEREVGHGGVSELHVVGTMHDRKALMASLSSAFVALPGGLGTFEELCEVLTWSILGLHDPPKPCALLNTDGYYNPLLKMFDQALAEGFLLPQHRHVVVTADSPEELLDSLAAWQPPVVKKWLEPGLE